MARTKVIGPVDPQQKPADGPTCTGTICIGQLRAGAYTAGLSTDLLDASGVAAKLRDAIPVGSKARTSVPLRQERVINHNRRKDGDSDNC